MTAGAQAAAAPRPMAEDGSGPTTGARPHYTGWHENVTGCESCPFSSERGQAGDELACEAHGVRFEPARHITDVERVAGTPPEWCPLRAGPRVVKLQESAPAGRPPVMPTSAPAEGSLVGAMRDARAELAARGIKVDAAAWLAEDAIDDDLEDDAEPATYSREDDEPACPDCHEPAHLGHTAECGIAAEILAAQDEDRQDDHAADAIVSVLHRGFLPHLRAAIDRALTSDATKENS